MDLPVRDVRSKLVNKFQFTLVGSGRGPHDKYRLDVDGRYVAHTQIPRAPEPIRDVLAGRIALQLGVTTGEFRQMIACTMDRDAYLAKVLPDSS